MGNGVGVSVCVELRYFHIYFFICPRWLGISIGNGFDECLSFFVGLITVVVDWRSGWARKVFGKCPKCGIHAWQPNTLILQSQRGGLLSFQIPKWFVDQRLEQMQGKSPKCWASVNCDFGAGKIILLFSLLHETQGYKMIILISLSWMTSYFLKIIFSKPIVTYVRRNFHSSFSRSSGRKEWEAAGPIKQADVSNVSFNGSGLLSPTFRNTSRSIRFAHPVISIVRITILAYCNTCRQDMSPKKNRCSTNVTAKLFI